MSSDAPRVRARPLLRHLPVAEHGGPVGVADDSHPVRADFSTSVNAYGPAPSVVAAVRAAVDPAYLAPYPDPSCSAARGALAAYLDVAPDAIALGAGAAELILAVALAFVRAGDHVVVPPHAFAEYARAVALCGGRAVVPPVDGSARAMAPTSMAEALVREIATQRPRVVFLCTPESPVGRAWTRDELAAVAEACRRAGTLLVLDQSFDAFTERPLGTPALPGHPVTLHLRSLTKDHALAGLRVGYLVGPPALIAPVERARMPWTVSTPAQAAAVAACAPEALAHVHRTTATLREAAAELRAACATLGLTAVPSDVHYFLIDVGDGRGVAQQIRVRHALKVRDCTSFGLPAHVRIAARTLSENRLLLAALADVAAELTDSAAAVTRTPTRPRPRTRPA